MFRIEDLPERISRRINRGVSDCWEWTGNKGPNGYGILYVLGGSKANQKREPAHRATYRLAHGDVPVGLELDHLCRNRICVNPAHLEAVTRQENVRRGIGPSVLAQINGAKTHCKKGHAFDEHNTYLRPSGGRGCRQCQHDRYLRNRSARAVSA